MYSNITNYIYIISSLDPELNPFFPVGLHNTSAGLVPPRFHVVLLIQFYFSFTICPMKTPIRGRTRNHGQGVNHFERYGTRLQDSKLF